MHYDLASGYCIHSVSEKEARREALRLTDGSGEMTTPEDKKDSSINTVSVIGIGAVVLLLLSQAG